MDTLTDAALVERILDGDSGALATLYDRYADRIHTMCAHMLRDDDAAADVTAEVFLTAAERLGQLREPAKLKSWLYAIARHEVYRRTRLRRREVSLGAVGAVGLDPAALSDDFADSGADPADLAAVDDFSVVDPFGSGRPGPADEVGLDPGANPADLAALLQDAAAGLDDRDRMVLELHLAQGLDGQELADALGVKRDHGYQLVHRMKERLEAATSALLIARSGRPLCDGLDEVADSWDGEFNVLWRKRFARHIKQCERCGSLRSRLTKAVLSGTALALSAQSTVLAAPISARERFLAEAPARVGVPRRGRWRSDGFPPADGGRRRWPLVAGAVVVALLVLGGGALLLDPGEVEEVFSAPVSVSTSTPPTTTTSVVVTTVPLLPGLPPPPGPAPEAGVAIDEPSEETTSTAPAQQSGQLQPPAPVPTPAPPPPAPPPPPPPPSTTTTTQPPDVTGPSVSISGPSCVAWGGSGSFTASASDPSGVSGITLSWSGGGLSGSKSSGGSSISVALTFPQPATSVTFSATATDGNGNSGQAGRSVTSGPSC